MFRLMRLAPAAALCAALIAAPTAGCSKPAEDQAFGEKVRAYLLAHPEVIAEAIEKAETRKQAEQNAAAKVAIRQNRDKLERDPRDVVAGNAKGAVTVVEFFDYRCPYCKVAGPGVVRLLKDNPDVRLVLKEFPILSESSEQAARSVLASKGTGKAFDLYQALLQEKALDEDAIARVLKTQGLDPAATRTAGQSKAISDQLSDVHALAAAIGVNGTPAFIVGDTMLPGWQAEALQAAIEAQRKALKKG